MLSGASLFTCGFNVRVKNIIKLKKSHISLIQLNLRLIITDRIKDNIIETELFKRDINVKSPIKMKKIAIAIYHNGVALRLDSAENLMLVTTEDGKVRSRELVLLREEDPLRKIDIIFLLKPDVLICGGLTKLCGYKLSHSDIKVIPWVRGNTEYILSLCLKNRFIEGDYDKSDYKSSHRSHP
jgi:hypothetical protein